MCGADGEVVVLRFLFRAPNKIGLMSQADAWSVIRGVLAM
jgi:hypothetical protein